MESTTSTASTAPKEGKFIMVKGKKIKILAKSELPNSQIMKIGLTSPKDKTLKFKILQNLLNCESPKPVSDVDKQTPAQTARAIDKKALSDTHTVAAKPTDKCTDNKMVRLNGKRIIAALDSAPKQPLKIDRAIQTETATCDAATQKDTTFDLEALLADSEDFSLLMDDSLLRSPRKIESPMMADLNSTLHHTGFDNPGSAVKQKQEIFFRELRSALQCDDKGNLPIHIGVLTNDLKIVKRNCFLLKILKQSIDMPNGSGSTPLQLSIVYEASLNIIQCLLEEGAQVHQCDVEGNNILHYAVEYRRKEALKMLLHNSLRADLSIDQHNNEGLTPLMLCCLNRNYDCAEVLLEASADPNVKDQISGKTPLFHAVELFDVGMVELLLQFSACTKIKNFFGTSPHDAVYEIEDIPDTIKYLILKKTSKRKAPDEPGRRSQKAPVQLLEKKKVKVLRTYARFERISPANFKKTPRNYLANRLAASPIG
ncbi:unnamed protein product [Phyllotreta striolata]|uniref:Uncharacterized protein n=1 Tax=Phyllotreta striolata TaxID=444603 RepID=A0A9N9TN54_PHYSR|nr:unnamed protein product [Phyllotreta striolata]